MNFARHMVRVWPAFLLISAATAGAAVVNKPVPTSSFITLAGYDWAWAFPISPDGVFGQGSTSAQYRIDLSYQAQFGWRLPTAAELLLAPAAVDFLFGGANVRVGSNLDPATGAFFNFSTTTGHRPTEDGACATPYFSTSYRECDWYNGRGLTSADWWNPDKLYGAGAGRQLSTTDTLVVRVAAQVSPVPEPGSLGLAAFGLAVMVGLRRERRTRVSRL